jgi:DNA-binding NtrC family response regulator
LAAPAHPFHILHPCLDAPRHGVPLAEATLTDRQRLGLLLEGCALDAHLGSIGWRPVAGWEGAVASSRGRLAAVAVVAGAPARGAVDTAAERALVLLHRLFRSEDLPGRGEARRVARELARRWALYLTPARADDLVADVLRTAPFLWLERFAAYRESLGASIRAGDVETLSVAGHPGFRRRVLRRARSLRELYRLLRAEEAAMLWSGETAQEVREPRSGSWLANSDRAATEPGALDRLAVLHRAGRWRAAIGEAVRLRREGGARGTETELARLAIDALLHLRRWRGAAEWAAFAGDRAAPESAEEARLLGAWVAWESGAEDGGGAEDGEHLSPPPATRSIEPLLVWARVEAERQPEAAGERLSLALRDRARTRGCHRGGLWLELGRARRGSDATAAERAFAHAHRHFRRGDHPVELWRATAALAESRLRRGAFDGVDAVVTCLAEQARASADRSRELAAAILGVRLELARGRDERAATAARALRDELPRGCRDRAASELETLRALAERRLDDSAPAGGTSLGPPPAPRAPAARGAIVGTSRALADALRRIDRLARGEVPVLLCGETGTGKELAAKRLHAGSSRRDRAFLAVNCAALSESLLLTELFGHARGAFTGAERDHAGVFEAAHGGVVFLDEIGDLPIGAQGALLRVLQEGEVRRVGESRPRRVDVRVVAATHRDLAALVERGAFRQDLYYRLNVATVRLPPLRERGEDVLLLARHFLGEHGGAFDLASDAEELLIACAWPGNVRELRSVVQVAAAVHDGEGLLRARDLEVPPAPRPPTSYHAALDAERRRLLEAALSAAGGRRAEAARMLGITPQAVSYLVRRLDLERGSTRSDGAPTGRDCRRARQKLSGRDSASPRREGSAPFR